MSCLCNLTGAALGQKMLSAYMTGTEKTQQGHTTMNLMGRPLLPCFCVSRAPDRSSTAVHTAMPMVLPHHASLSGCCFEPADVLPLESPAVG